MRDGNNLISDEILLMDLGSATASDLGLPVIQLVITFRTHRYGQYIQLKHHKFVPSPLLLKFFTENINLMKINSISLHDTNRKEFTTKKCFSCEKKFVSYGNLFLAVNKLNGLLN